MFHLDLFYGMLHWIHCINQCNLCITWWRWDYQFLMVNWFEYVFMILYIRKINLIDTASASYSSCCKNWIKSVIICPLILFESKYVYNVSKNVFNVFMVILPLYIILIFFIRNRINFSLDGESWVIASSMSLKWLSISICRW